MTSLVRRFRVHAESDRLGCAAATREFLLDHGVAREVALRAGLCVAELYGNAARHARDGEVYVSIEEHDVEVLVLDRGPGIRDVPKALEDGVSAGHRRTPDAPRRDLAGLGTGLGTVLRNADRLRVEPREGGGLSVRARFRLDSAATRRSQSF